MDVYAAVTDRILKQLESGTVPWVKPWSDTAYGSPHNAISGKAYRGIAADGKRDGTTGEVQS